MEKKHKKDEAENFLRDSNSLTIAQSQLWQLYMSTLNKNIKIGTQAMEESQQELKIEEEKVIIYKQEHEELSAAFDSLNAEYQVCPNFMLYRQLF